MGVLESKSLNRLKAMINQIQKEANNNTDVGAYAVFDLYDCWNDIPEVTQLDEGKIVSYSDGILYKVNEGQGHKKQESWTPDTAHSVFTPIPRTSEDGSKENPITWVQGMVSEKDKYYVDDGVLYLCIEDSGIGLYGQPKDLARYFQKVEE